MNLWKLLGIGSSRKLREAKKKHTDRVREANEKLRAVCEHHKQENKSIHLKPRPGFHLRESM